MCEPTTLVAASLAMSGMQAYSQYQQGQYGSAVAKQNANIADAQTLDAVNRGNSQAEEVRRRNAQAAGSQAASMAANGGDLTSGSNLDIFGDTAQFGMLDSLTAISNAKREAFGYQVQSTNSLAEATSQRRQGNMGAATTLLTAPINAYGAYRMGGGEWNPFAKGNGKTPMLSDSSLFNNNPKFKIGGY